LYGIAIEIVLGGLAWLDLFAAAEMTSNADGSGAFASGKYRNLFAEAGHSQKEIREKVDSAFQQLFHGDPNTQAVYYEAGTNANGLLAFTTDIKHRDVRSEGLSYGMIIAVQMNRQTEFNAIWNWSKTYLYVSETNHPSFGFFAWQARTNGVRMSQFVHRTVKNIMSLHYISPRTGGGMEQAFMITSSRPTSCFRACAIDRRSRAPCRRCAADRAERTG